MFRRLRAGEPVTDEELDRLFPAWVRRSSRRHWTPVGVAVRAAQLLVAHRRTRVLDVGCGPGKLCLVGACVTDGHFVGVEQRPHLVRVGREVARRCQVERCEILHGNVLDVDWRRFDAFYLFNPFAENLPGYPPIDATVRLSRYAYRKYVRFVEERLAELPAGARVVTYHGFGGRLPARWREVATEYCGTGPLELWVKGA